MVCFGVLRFLVVVVVVVCVFVCCHGFLSSYVVVLCCGRTSSSSTFYLVKTHNYLYIYTPELILLISLGPRVSRLLE